MNAEKKKLKVRRTHCRRGHRLSAANIYVRKDGYFECVQCMKDRVTLDRIRKRLRQRKGPRAKLSYY